MEGLAIGTDGIVRGDTVRVIIKGGVSNGLCEHLRACEQYTYFSEHEQLSNFSCKQRAL